MGNVFLDMDMFKEAYVAFTTALKIDKTYNPARTGLYNYYMANKQEKKALALISEYPEYLPIFVKAVKKISDEIYTNEQDIPEDASEEALEDVITSYSIHYTKLYDSRSQRVMLQAGIPKPITKRTAIFIKMVSNFSKQKDCFFLYNLR